MVVKLTLKLRKQKLIQEEVFKYRRFSCEDNRGIEKLKDLNLTVRAGEIVGIAGVDGNGQTELIEAITGLTKS